MDIPFFGWRCFCAIPFTSRAVASSDLHRLSGIAAQSTTSRDIDEHSGLDPMSINVNKRTEYLMSRIRVTHITRELQCVKQFTHTRSNSRAPGTCYLSNPGECLCIAHLRFHCILVELPSRFCDTRPSRHRPNPQISLLAVSVEQQPLHRQAV